MGCRDTNTIPLLSRNSSGTATNNSTTFSTQLEKAKSRWITVEPVVVLSMMFTNSMNILSGQLVQRKIADQYDFDLPSESNKSCVANESDEDYDMNQKIQAETSRYTLFFLICTYLPAIFTIIIIGTLNDMIGRKVVIMIALLGFVAEVVCYLAVDIFDLTVNYLFIGTLIRGITGGTPSVLNTVALYISDITTEEQRNLRFVVIFCAFDLSFVLTQIPLGYLVDSEGFTAVFWILLGIVLLSLAYLSIPGCVYETNEETSQQSASQTIKRVHQVLRANQNPSKFLVLLMLMFLISVQFYGGHAVFSVYMLGLPFCLDPLFVGYLVTYNRLITITGKSVSFRKAVSPKKSGICKFVSV